MFLECTMSDYDAQDLPLVVATFLGYITRDFFS